MNHIFRIAAVFALLAAGTVGHWWRNEVEGRSSGTRSAWFAGSIQDIPQQPGESRSELRDIPSTLI
jgi:hypothetical protein